LLDTLAEDAVSLFGIDGIGGIAYADSATWAPIARQWNERASTAVSYFVTQADWDKADPNLFQDAETDIVGLVKDHSGLALDWIRKNVFGEPVANARSDVLKNFYMAMFLRSETSIRLHLNGSYQMAIDEGHISTAEARRSLGNAVSIQEMLAKLGDGGYFSELAQIYAVNGLGNPLIIVVAVVIAAALIAALAFIILRWWNERTLLIKQLAFCDDLARQGQYELAMQCHQGLRQDWAKANDLIKPIAQAINTVTIAAVSLAVVYVGIKVLLPAFRGSRRGYPVPLLSR
jgi:hypothetical protein